MSPLHAERAGESGPTVLLVHGSGAPGWGTWEAQRALADRYRHVVPHRSGWPPNAPLERIDFDRQADDLAALIEPGTHLVGHSYGGIISMLAAARAGDRAASLTVIEPPAFGVARGNPAVEETIRPLQAAFGGGLDPRSFTIALARSVGSSFIPPDPLPPHMEAWIRASMAERPPWEAVIPFATLRGFGCPVLVVSGGHHAAFDAVCDVIEHELHAERAVIRGSGHSAQRTGAPFNERLSAFIHDVS